IDGISYRYKNDTTDINYESGKQTKFTITINKKAHSGEYELSLVEVEVVDWEADLEAHGGEARQYFVVKMDSPGTLGEKIRATKKNPNKIKNLKISGKICATDFQFMRDSMEILQAVNLKETEITTAWSARIQPKGESEYRNVIFAGEAPESSDERKAIIMAAYPNCLISNSLEIQYNAYEIPSDAFRDKTSLVYFCFPEKVTKIGGSAFNGTLLSGALIIPNDVTEIGNDAFRDTNITSLQLPHGLKVLEQQVFYGCKSLSGTLSLPESLESLGSACFNGCSMLSGNLILPSKLTIIPSSCFYGCSGLSGDLVIPEGVTTIGGWAFWRCEGFTGSLTLPEGLKQLGYTAFFRCYFQGELTIPSQIQTIPAECFSYCGFSSIVFAENSELIKIGERAFIENKRLCEPLVLPEGVMTIEGKAFYSCQQLPAIVLPKSLTVIGLDAFGNCYNLSAITSKATTPPVCGAGAWDGVAKDNFTVEVPEQSVVKYQTQNGWSDFRRIAAHRDFSISRPQLRLLNAQHSETYVMRAPSGEAWSVESAPEWVTVTPSSGVGKMDVTVTVNEMSAAEVGTFQSRTGGTVASPTYKSYNGRAGEVVFLLNDKDYRTKMTVEQFDYEYGDGDVLVHQSATEGKGVNIVFMGDCFDARDVADGSYLAGIEEAIGYYFAIEPYKTYKPYFNIYTIFGVSKDSGMGTVNTVKESKFGSMYSLEGIAPDHAICYEYAMKAENVNEDNLSQTLVVLVENTEDYGGICYMWGDGSAIACCPMSRDAYPYDFRGIVQHEAGGHGFGKLADEYIYHNAFIQSCTCPCCEHLDSFRASKARGWYRNLSEVGDMKSVEWAHLIYHPDYSNIVDMYEGGFFHTRGIYRSEATSCMNNNIPYYSAISRQEMVERIMKYAGKEFSLEEFYAKDVRDASNNTVSPSRLHVEENAITLKGASKQLPPKYMGDKPQLKKSNK
ncbi:MAG: leucine-rich repeat protein, partial [Alistipes sp.]|nr:leucine-rich repeat protein [Alistipes sp.]